MTVLRQSRLMLGEPHAGLSAAQTNPMIDAIRAKMAAQFSDAVGQDLEAGRLDFRLASAPGAEAFETEDHLDVVRLLGDRQDIAAIRSTGD